MPITQDSSVASLREQWTTPGDIFSVLLILGGDVVQLALVSLCGDILTPLTFSFGSVAYAISAVLSTVGENRLIKPSPEVSLLAINLNSGYGRANQSWVLGRLFKTYNFWMPSEVRNTANDVRAPEGLLDEEANGNGRPAALCVAVYDWSEKSGLRTGVPRRDWVWWSGLAMTVLQLGVSAVPFALEYDWTIFLVTLAGNALSFASGSLPQWRHEKWFARRLRADKNVALTLGNGSKHVIILQGREGDLDIEDLANGWAPDMWSTRAWTLTLAVLWMALLITSTGIKANTWYLLTVGGLGMLHNLLVAGIPRYPPSLGLPIELARIPSREEGTLAVFGQEKVMWTLMELEQKYKNYGRSLLGEFFPGKLREWEEAWWRSTDFEERQKLLSEKKSEYFSKSKNAEGNFGNSIL